ncbi:MAG: hypothetical protein HYS39_02670 [Proteobacteria bacterium]|nr:hypothetical protein [Pseudomonadota bacterium]
MKKEIVPEVSSKSTKDQILAAYQEVVKKLHEQGTEKPQETKKKEEDVKIVSVASSHTQETLIEDLGQLKLKAIKQIDNLSESLFQEFEKLKEIRSAVSIEQQHLKDLYHINETAHTLAALLQVQNQKKEDFELEMEEKKRDLQSDIAKQQEHWKEQKELLEKSYKDQKELLEKTRKRDEEEYNYNLEQKRRRETNDYSLKKESLEKESAQLREDLEKRESMIKDKENSFQDLTQQVTEFPNRMEQAIRQAKKETEDLLLQKVEFEKQLIQKEYEMQIQLHQQRIVYLEQKIKEQEILNRELSTKADSAIQQIQTIACRALDTSSNRYKTYANVEEK